MCVKSWCMALGETSKQAGTKKNEKQKQKPKTPNKNKTVPLALERTDRSAQGESSQEGGEGARELPHGPVPEPARRGESGGDRHLGILGTHPSGPVVESIPFPSLGAWGVKASTLLVCTSSWCFSGVAQFREGSFLPGKGRQPTAPGGDPHPHRESRRDWLYQPRTSQVAMLRRYTVRGERHLPPSLDAHTHTHLPGSSLAPGHS